MVDYDYESDSDVFYQTGGFCVAKRTLLEQVCWDDRLLFFDKHNTVWHYDHSYHSNNLTCNKKPKELTLAYTCLEFICLLNKFKK